MTSEMLLNALSITNGYLVQNYSTNELKIIRDEIKTVLGNDDNFTDTYNEKYSYEKVQEILSGINEKDNSRKIKGVFCTPADIVKFILFNSAKMLYGKSEPDNLNISDLNDIPYDSFCFEKKLCTTLRAAQALFCWLHWK
ncbi:MAG: hypothetical protein LUD77_07845 [Clostridiales bacterium]|nr:hypothetical protein [Clostridiales bacterium]